MVKLTMFRERARLAGAEGNAQDLGEDNSGKGESFMVKNGEVDNVQGKSTTRRCGGE